MPSTKLRVLAVVPSRYDTSPGQRFRMEQWQPHLERCGVEITYAPFETPGLSAVLYRQGHYFSKLAQIADALLARARDVRHAGEYDVVYLFREAALLGPAVFERWLARKTPVVYDFDDAIFVPYRSPANGWLSYLKFAGKTASVCRIASHVMVGNQYLADYASQFNRNVTIVPTTLDTEKCVPIAKAPSAIPVVGWTGSYSTIQHLDTARSVLQELAKAVRFRLRVIGTQEYLLDGVNVESVLWQSATELDDLRPIEIGIMPLPDDPWSRGKCGFKALQFMALGVPCVCSPVGVNSTIIQDGVNGFLASTPDEWVTKLKRLIEDVDLRSRMGREARRTVVERYSAAVHAPRVLAVFKSVAERARS